MSFPSKKLKSIRVNDTNFEVWYDGDLLIFREEFLKENDEIVATEFALYMQIVAYNDNMFDTERLTSYGTKKITSVRDKQRLKEIFFEHCGFELKDQWIEKAEAGLVMKKLNGEEGRQLWWGGL